MLNIFRIVSLLEGISFLLILSVTLGFIGRDMVFYLGMGHGILFLVYFMASVLVSHKLGWSIVVWMLVFFAGTIPFAFLVVDWFLQKEKKKLSTMTDEKNL